MTEVRDNSDAEWEEKIVKEVEERRAKSKTRSQDLDRILLLTRRQLDEDVNLACAGHQARYDSDVSKHLQKLKLEAYKAKESTPDLKARIDQETTLLHQQVPRAQEMMDIMTISGLKLVFPRPSSKLRRAMIFWVSRKPSKPGMPSKPGHLLTKPGHPLTKAGLPLTKPKAPLPKTPPWSRHLIQESRLRMAMARAMARTTAATARVGTPEATRAATNTDRGPTTMLALPQEPIKPKATSQVDNLAGSRHGFRRGSSPQASKPTLNPKLQLQLQDPPFVISPFRWRLQGGRRRAVHPQLRLGLLRQKPYK